MVEVIKVDTVITDNRRCQNGMQLLWSDKITKRETLVLSNHRELLQFTSTVHKQSFAV